MTGKKYPLLLDWRVLLALTLYLLFVEVIVAPVLRFAFGFEGQNLMIILGMWQLGERLYFLWFSRWFLIRIGVLSEVVDKGKEVGLEIRDWAVEYFGPKFDWGRYHDRWAFRACLASLKWGGQIGGGIAVFFVSFVPVIWIGALAFCRVKRFRLGLAAYVLNAFARGAAIAYGWDSIGGYFSR